jgi:hypothetical protein
VRSKIKLDKLKLFTFWGAGNKKVYRLLLNLSMTMLFIIARRTFLMSCSEHKIENLCFLLLTIDTWTTLEKSYKAFSDPPHKRQVL